jgi:hypothetical protein
MTVLVESWEDSGADPEVVTWFAQYEPLLMGFAERNNLAIAKYLKDSPSWHFVFAHPKGGQGRIDVTRVSEEGMTVSGVWHSDDYDVGTRSLKTWDALGETQPERLLETLSATLQKVLSLSGENYAVVAPGYKAMWQKYMTREQVEKSKYPLPRVAHQ